MYIASIINARENNNTQALGTSSIGKHLYLDLPDDLIYPGKSYKLYMLVFLPSLRYRVI